MLVSSEQGLFFRLAVFAGGCSYEVPGVLLSQLVGLPDRLVRRARAAPLPGGLEGGFEKALAADPDPTAARSVR